MTRSIYAALASWQYVWRRVQREGVGSGVVTRFFSVGWHVETNSVPRIVRGRSETLGLAVVDNLPLQLNPFYLSTVLVVLVLSLVLVGENSILFSPHFAKHT
jgi:hypothetical protein